ncbi:hypothetical protein C9I86_08345 [Photobacterium sp. NCIMB 13483]|nr:hypothetical protein C9I86_08345 [Photobacterium sp. NCIMB 13483]
MLSVQYCAKRRYGTGIGTISCCLSLGIKNSNKVKGVKITVWFSIVCALLAIILLILHMNIEIVYGKELPDA